MAEFKHSICFLIVLSYHSYLHPARILLRSLNKKFRNYYTLNHTSQPGAIEYHCERDIIQLKEKQRNQLKMHSLYEAIECQDKGRKYVRIEEDRIDLMDLTENTFQLPHDIELASNTIPNSTSTADLINFEVQRNRIALVSFGIPSSMAIGKDVSLKNASRINDEEQKLFYKNCKGYAQIVERALQYVFDRIYPEDHVRQYISIPVYNDSLSSEVILELYQHGAIDEEEKIKLLRLSSGIEY